MQKQQADTIESWFDAYVTGFYNDDTFANANWKMKEDHSRRVCGEMVRLAGALGLDAARKQLARVIGLLHDVGRFEQFARYRTYSDPRSVSHGPLGVEIIGRHNVLKALDPAEARIIEEAVGCHGLLAIPPQLTGDELFFAKMIRDADKLDVYRVVAAYYTNYKKDPASFPLEIELPDEPRCSPHVVENVLAGRQTDYSTLRTLSDMIVIQLGWVYDIHFAATVRRIDQLGLLDRIMDLLPHTEQIERVSQSIRAYIKQRIAREG